MAFEGHFNFEGDRPLYASLFEPGTTMPRRSLLLDRLRQALARARRVDSCVAILVLSDITDVNSAGHPADLSDVGRTLQVLVRGDETVARGSGTSTLIVVCNMVDNEQYAQLVAQRLLERAAIECRVQVTVSNAADDAEALLTRAIDDDAMPRTAPVPQNEPLTTAMRLVDEVIDYRAQLHATIDPQRRAELEWAMDVRAARIRAYLDSTVNS
jgi:GGDEF domain-containing protein